MIEAPCIYNEADGFGETFPAQNDLEEYDAGNFVLHREAELVRESKDRTYILPSCSKTARLPVLPVAGLDCGDHCGQQTRSLLVRWFSSAAVVTVTLADELRQEVAGSCSHRLLPVLVGVDGQDIRTQ